MGRGKEYKYPHDYPDNYVAQQYLPDALRAKSITLHSKTNLKRHKGILAKNLDKIA